MKSGKEKIPFYENPNSYKINGLMSLAGCGLLLAAAFLHWKSLAVMTDEKVKGGITVFKSAKQGFDSIFIRDISNEISEISFNIKGALPCIYLIIYISLIIFLLLAGIKDNLTRKDFFVNKKKRIRIISLFILVVLMILMTHTSVFQGTINQLEELSKSWTSYVEEAQKNHVNNADNMYVHYRFGFGCISFWLGIILYFGSVVFNFILETLNEDS